MKLYLASRFTRIGEMNQYREQLVNDGHVVVSRWLDETPGEGDDYEKSGMELWPGIALIDVEDVKKCEALVCFTEEPRTWTRGGRHVEFGMGIALSKYLFVVGPVENVFYALPRVIVFPDWEAARAEIKETDRRWAAERGQISHTIPLRPVEKRTASTVSSSYPAADPGKTTPS